MKVITKVGDIPIGSTVTKATGAVQYIIQDKLIIYGEPKQEINALAGTRFMVPKEQNAWSKGINAVPISMEVAWLIEEYELYEYLDEKFNHGDNK